MVILLGVLLQYGCGRAGQDREGGEIEVADRIATATAEDPAATQEVAQGFEEVNQFLAYRSADSIVDLKLWAGFGGVNGAWNFDGYYDGNATIVVPVNWQIKATFQNLDANVPHSVGIIAPTDSVPFSGSDARIAFPGATSSAFIAGVTSRSKPQTFTFRADRAGMFRVFCGVPGHGPNGMWIWFEVSVDASVPDMRADE